MQYGTIHVGYVEGILLDCLLCDVFQHVKVQQWVQY